MNTPLRTLLAAASLAGGILWLPSASAQPAWDACQLLRQADVEAAFAPRKFDAGTLAKEVVKRTPQMPQMSTCTYVSTDKVPADIFTVTLTARRALTDAQAVTPPMTKAAAAQINPKAKPVDVDGLGDGAHWVDLGSAFLPSVQLNAFKGARVHLSFGSGGRRVSQQAAADGLKKLAATTLARVP